MAELAAALPPHPNTKERVYYEFIRTKQAATAALSDLPSRTGGHIDYIRQEMQHDAPDSVPTEDELLTFFQSPDKPTKLDAYQQMLATDKLLEYAEINLRTLCDLIRYQQLKELGIVHSVKEFIQLFHPNEQEDTP